MKAVIQCGGMGTRLRPFTSVLPKPLMPIGARPVLELLLKWLRRNGIDRGILYMQVTRSVAPRNHAFPLMARPALVITCKRLKPVPVFSPEWRLQVHARRHS